MNKPLENIFRTQIRSLYGIEFEDFIKNLFLAYYAENNYTPIRQSKDDGADGIIIPDNCVVACYGPNKINKSSIVSKINSDLKSYSKNWEQEYKNWKFIINHDIPPYVVKEINKLKKDATILGIEQLLDIINKLPYPLKIKLGDNLNIDKCYFAEDYLEKIIEDLMQYNISNNNCNISYEKPIYFDDKVELNFGEKEDIVNIKNIYDRFNDEGIFTQIKNILSSYKDNDIGIFKTRITTDYGNIKGNFDYRFSKLTEKYVDKYSSEDDDNYLHYIKAILIYTFEQCLIGKKTKIEQDIIQKK